MRYLMNGWYAAAYSDAVGGEPLRRTLLGIPIVLFRTAAGAVAALEDRCPHRFAPLSQGVVVGNELQCGYHGLRFNTAGRCSFNPHSVGNIPRQVQVRSFPVTERHGVIWFWPGEQHKADPSSLPAAFAFLSDTEHFAAVRGYLHVKANYQLIIDNLLDLTHAPYLHPQFGVTGMKPEERLQATQSELVRKTDTVCARRIRYDGTPTDMMRDIFGVTAARMDMRSHMHWFAPSLLYFDAGMTLPGAAEADGYCLPAAHLITPETEFSSHYFFVQARNCFLDDEDVARAHLEATEFAFTHQDEPMLEHQQASMGATADLMSLGPVLLQTDAAPVAARRALAALISEEAGNR